jgi:hypothetical protein
VLPVPRSFQGSRVSPLARAAQGASRYCLSFTAAGLRHDLAAVVAGIYLEEGDWSRTQAAVLERNALQTRSTSSAKRLESELRQRLQTLSASQLELLARGTSDERCAMAWLAVLKRIPIAHQLATDLLAQKLSGLDPVLRRSDMAGFFEGREREHPELRDLALSSQQKVRSALLQMIREAGLLTGKATTGGVLGTVQRPLLSPQVQDLLLDEAPALMAGFLQSPLADSAKPTGGVKSKPRGPAKPSAKTKPGRQPAAKTAANRRKVA